MSGVSAGWFPVVTPAPSRYTSSPPRKAPAVAAPAPSIAKATPLSRNGYKVQITKTAVKRAIMQIAGLKPVQLRA